MATKPCKQAANLIGGMRMNEGLKEFLMALVGGLVYGGIIVALLIASL